MTTPAAVTATASEAEAHGGSVVFIITSMDVGGAETQLSYLAPLLKQRGWEVRVVTMTPPVSYVDRFAAAEVPLLSLDMQRGHAGLGAFTTTARWLREWRPDCVVGFMFHADILARLAGRWAGVPARVAAVRTSNLGGRFRCGAMRRTDRLTDAVVANSRAVEQQLLKQGLAAPDHLCVIPNGMDLSRFAAAAAAPLERTALGLPSAGFLWAAVGRLEVPKDYGTLLQATALLVKEGYDPRLAIAGEGSLRGELEAQIAALALTERVHLLGLRDDVPAVLTAADALVLCSAWEGMPGAVLEGMAAGRPVVATAVGGVAELVVEGETGWIVEPRSPEALAQGMARTMDLDPAARQAMGARGQSRIASHYTLESMTTAWDALLTKLVAAHGGPRARQN